MSLHIWQALFDRDEKRATAIACHCATTKKTKLITGSCKCSLALPLLSYVLDRLPFGNSLDGVSKKLIERLMRETNAPSWHSFAILSRKWRRHACTACRWLDEALPRDASIFEPGCGSAANLLWFGQKGFSKLYGSDIDLEALELGRRLASHLNMNLDLWQDDGIKPARLPENLDGILSVNWLYHIPGASFSSFLETYSRALKVGGYLACDMVTRRYDKVPGNQYHTNDQKLPVEQRRPSEYKIRLDREEMRALGIRHGLALIRSTCFVLTNPQRSVYLFRKVEE